MSHPLEALKGYPKDGPEMPERQKIYREKDRHDPGTGRRDREKRNGKGSSNWGDPIEDQIAAENDPIGDEEKESPVEDEPKIVEPAEKFFDNEEEEEPPKVKGVVKVPARFAGMVKTGDDVVVEVNAE